MFTSIIMFLSNGPASQIVMAMGIAFVALILHLHTQAYKEEADSWLQTASMMAIFLTLWVGLLSKTGVIDDFDLPNNPMGSYVYFLITMAIQAMPLVASAAGGKYKQASIKQSKPQEDQKACRET